MGFPPILAKAQGDSLRQDVLEAYDRVEAIRRNLDDLQPHLIGVDADTFRDLQVAIRSAESDLFRARVALDDDS